LQVRRHKYQSNPGRYSSSVPLERDFIDYVKSLAVKERWLFLVKFARLWTPTHANRKKISRAHNAKRYRAKKGKHAAGEDQG
jgi:hypothetical protein